MPGSWARRPRSWKRPTAAEEEQLATTKQHVRNNGGKRQVYIPLHNIRLAEPLPELMSNLGMIGEIMEADKRIVRPIYRSP